MKPSPKKRLVQGITSYFNIRIFPLIHLILQGLLLQNIVNITPPIDWLYSQDLISSALFISTFQESSWEEELEEVLRVPVPWNTEK